MECHSDKCWAYPRHENRAFTGLSVNAEYFLNSFFLLDKILCNQLFGSRCCELLNNSFELGRTFTQPSQELME